MFRTDENVKQYLKQVKLVSLAREGKTKEASHFLHANAQTLKHQGNLFLEAYLHYKLGRYGDALAIANKSDGGLTSAPVPAAQGPDARQAGAVPALARRVSRNGRGAAERSRGDRVRGRAGHQLRGADLSFPADAQGVPEARAAGGLRRGCVLPSNPQEQGPASFLGRLTQRLQSIYRRWDSLQSRELLINLVLIMIIIERTSLLDLEQVTRDPEGGARAETYVAIAKSLIAKVKQDMAIDVELMNLEDALDLRSFGSEKLADFMTVFILDTFIMQKQGRIEWHEKVLTNVKGFLPHMKSAVADQNLRVSVLSFNLYIDLLSRRSLGLAECTRYLGLVDEELKQVAKGSKVGNYLRRQLLANRAALLVHQDQCAQAKKTLRLLGELGQEKLDREMLPVELAVLVKTKNYKEFEALVGKMDARLAQSAPESEAFAKAQRCLGFLFQMGFYSSLNNQKKYCAVFETFLKEFFLPESRLPQEARFLGPKGFGKLATSVAFYVLKNNLLLASLKHQVVHLAEYVQDKNTLVAIAEGFLKKGDLGVAEKIYSELRAERPGDMVIATRLDYIYSLTSPERIDGAKLPEFEIAADFNTLQKLETDYIRILQAKRNRTLVGQSSDAKLRSRKIKKQKYGGAGIRQTGNEERLLLRKQRRKLKKRQRIRWPKHFNFDNPGARPDPKRWLPKYMRGRNWKNDLKRGVLTRNQGASGAHELDALANQNLYKNKFSTAAQETNRARKKRRRRRKK